jgi:hypothetical protein
MATGEEVDQYTGIEEEKIAAPAHRPAEVRSVSRSSAS